jgi:hypothetical protein
MRFSGAVGYATSVQESPGVFADEITEKTYYGDVTRQARRLEAPATVPPELNNNIALENSFSILADEEAYDNFEKMRYVVWNGKPWTITNVEVRRPRLILTIGGLWDGRTAD